MSFESVPSQLSDREKLARLRLIRSSTVGPVAFRHLLARFGDAETALKEVPHLAQKGGRRKPLKIPPKAEAERELAAVADLEATALFLGEPSYPVPLAAVEDAPPVLYALGHRHLLDRDGIAIVGARNASGIGRKIARSIAGELASHGLAVISGLARGIDSAAHEGALDGGTIAVLAGGLDVVYPKENEGLHEAIARQGAILSEAPPGLRPQARHFPRRNRIISGLSAGVLVVEAAQRSGSLITARLAGEQGREVFAVPGSPLDPRCRGTNSLIRSGAILTETAADILDALADRSPPMSEPGGDELMGGRPSAVPEVDEESRRRLREQLSPTPITVDELVRECNLTVAEVLTILLELELAGIAVRHPGNRVSLNIEDERGAP